MISLHSIDQNCSCLGGRSAIFERILILPALILNMIRLNLATWIQEKIWDFYTNTCESSIQVHLEMKSLILVRTFLSFQIHCKHQYRYTFIDAIF